MADNADVPTAKVIEKQRLRKPAPQVIGGYQLERVIGRGSCGEVYAAKDLDGKAVAIKIAEVSYSQTGLGAHRSFVNEASALAKIQHPNVLPISDIGIEGDHSYIISPLIETGWTLRDFGRNGHALDDDKILSIATRLGEAIEHIHQQGVIHRDIKPANILLDRALRPILFDFGVAVAVGQRQFGRMLGTPHYMAPEQVNGEPVDSRADQYAFAATLFELFSGRAPYGEIPKPLLFDKICNAPAPDLNQWRPDLPRALAQTLRRAMAKQPSARFSSVGDFTRMLASVELQAQGAEVEALFLSTALGEFSSELRIGKGFVRLERERALLRVLDGVGRRGRQLLTANSVFLHEAITPLQVTEDMRLQVVEWSHVSVLSLRDQARLWQAVASVIDKDAR